MPIPGADGSLYFASGIDNTGLIRGRQQATGIIRGMASQISKMDVFAGLSTAAIVAFSKISKKSWELSKDLDLSLREVQTISVSTQEHFDAMRDAVIRLSKEGPDSADELTKALYQIVSAGYDGAAGLELLDVASKAATAGVTDVKTAADGLTTVMNAWKISAENSTLVADTFFKTVEKGKTTFGELAANIAQVAPLAAAYEVSFEQVAAATATLTKQGTSTSMAMTQLRQALIAVNETLGQGWGQMYTLQEAFAEVARRAEESGKDIKEFTGRVEGALAILSTTGKNAEMAAQDLEAMKNAAGSSAAAFDRMSLAAKNNINVMRNRWHARLLNMGESLIKMFGRVAGALNSRAVVKGLKEEAEQARLAVLDITSLAEGTEKRKKAIEELQLAFPDYFGDLDTEKTKNEDLLAAMKLMNEEYAKKIVLQEYADELGKVAREEERLEKRRIQHIKALELTAKRLNYTGLSYDELLKKMREVAEEESFERVRAGMGKGAVAGLKKGIEFLDNYSDELEKIEDKEAGIQKARDRILELLKLDGKSVDIDVNVNAGGEGGGEGGVPEVFTKEEWEDFQEQIEEAKTAYKEWNEFKKTSLADELKDEYDQYIEHGEDYETYLDTMLEAFKDNAQARVLIIKELADIEAQYIKAAEKIMREFYRAMAEEAKKTLDEDIKEAFENITKSQEKFIEKQLLKEAPEEAAKAYVKFGKIVFLTDEQLQDLQATTYQYIDALGTMGSALQNFASQGNEAMGYLGEGLQGVANVLSGNYIAGALQVINALNGYVMARQEAKRELSAAKEEAHVKALNHEIDRLNRALDEHLYLLSKLQGTDWLVGARTSVNFLKEQIKELDASIRDTQLRELAQKDPSKKPVGWGDYKSAKWLILNEFGRGIDELSNAEIQEFLDKYWDILLPGPRDQIQEWLDQIKEAERAVEEMMAEIQYETVGFDAGSITDSIVSAFEEGKVAAEDFANTFEDLMKQAMIASFQRDYLDKRIQKFYDNLYDEMTDTDTPGEGMSVGGLSEFEIDRLRGQWESIIEQATTGWEAIEEIIGEMSGAGPEDPNSLAGAIRRSLTEETGSLLAGKMNMLVMDVREMKLVQHAAADTMEKIEQNTSFNHYLSRLDQMSQDLSALKNQMLG